MSFEQFDNTTLYNMQKTLTEKHVISLNAMQRKDYENSIDSWKVNGKKGPVPNPPGSFKVEDVRFDDSQAVVPEVRFHPEIPICEKYTEPVDNRIYTAVVGMEIPGFSPARYQSLDILPIGVQGYAPDGKYVTKVGVMTPFGNMVWYQ